ncbi:hypothetical protein LTR86_002972 [Recurvomyces mirabilis]|nr:hypothetical protein LTR86_002972 [Recurvomyces mirabilis]
MAYRNPWTRDRYGNAVFLPAHLLPSENQAYDTSRSASVQGAAPQQSPMSPRNTARGATQQAQSTSSTATRTPPQQQQSQQSQQPICQRVVPGAIVVHLQVTASPEGYRSIMDIPPTAHYLVLTPTKVETIQLRDRVNSTSRTVYYPAGLSIRDVKLHLLPSDHADVVLALSVLGHREKFSVLSETVDAMGLEDVIKDFEDDLAFELGRRPGD